MISLPATEWADFDHARTPNLDRLFAESSVGAMVTNGVDRPTSLPSGYVTIGAGARATGERVDRGPGLRRRRAVRARPAGVVFTTRTGIPAGHGLVYMPIADTIDSNDSELYGAEVGSLGDELAGPGSAGRSSPTVTAPIRARPRRATRRGGAPRSPR